VPTHKIFFMPPIINAIGGNQIAVPLKKNVLTNPVLKVVAKPNPAPPAAPTLLGGLLGGKEGGTVVGNAIRDVVSQATDGHFGTGTMMQKAGETDEAYQNRLIQAAGSAAESFNNTAKNNSTSTNMADSFKSGVTQTAITNAIKTYAPTVILIGAGIFVVKKFILKKGGGSRRRSY
jgi:predicted lipid-binding transport protein (Tim44 family)